MHKTYFKIGLVVSNIYTYLLTNIYIDRKYILIARPELPDKYRRSN